MQVGKNNGAIAFLFHLFWVLQIKPDQFV
jgi:hypothetical protein